MNTSFDKFKLVNTYGAFGSVGKERTEIIIKGAYHSDKIEWKEYEFKCKPGNVTRTPCIITPYHYRLDWLAWFAGFQPYYYQPWTVHFVAKLLTNDPKALSLISNNPFEGEEAPDMIKIDLYKYKYSGFNDKGWYKRNRLSEYL